MAGMGPCFFQKGVDGGLSLWETCRASKAKPATWLGTPLRDDRCKNWKFQREREEGGHLNLSLLPPWIRFWVASKLLSSSKRETGKNLTTFLFSFFPSYSVAVLTIQDTGGIFVLFFVQYWSLTKQPPCRKQVEGLVAISACSWNRLVIPCSLETIPFGSFLFPYCCEVYTLFCKWQRHFPRCSFSTPWKGCSSYQCHFCEGDQNVVYGETGTAIIISCELSWPYS